MLLFSNNDQRSRFLKSFHQVCIKIVTVYSPVSLQGSPFVITINHNELSREVTAAANILSATGAAVGCQCLEGICTLLSCFPT